MARQNKDIEILVRLASQGNFDQAQAQLERLREAQEGTAAAGAGAIGKLKSAWATWTSLAEVSASRIKNAFLTTLGPIGAIIVIIQTVIQTFGRLINWVKDYQKAQDELNKTFGEASKAIADANENKKKYADATGIDLLNRAIKEQEQDLRAISKSHDEIAEKLKQQQETTFGITWALASTTRQYQAHLAALVQQGIVTERNLEAQKKQLEFEEKAKKAAEKFAAEKLSIEKNLSEETTKLLNDEYEVRSQLLAAQVLDASAHGIEKLSIIKDGAEQEVTLAEYVALATAQIEADKTRKLKIEKDKQVADTKAKTEKEKQFEDAKQKALVQGTSAALSFIQGAWDENTAMYKATSIALATINTYQAYTAALAVPFVGPVLAPIVLASGLKMVANIAGMKLKAGALVQGTPEGTKATIGEENRDEVVLPLEDPRAMERVSRAVADATRGRGGRGGAGPAGMSGDEGGTTIINLNVTAALDWREIMNRLAEEARDGNAEIVALARRLGDLNELHAGRAG